ncbi:MAG: ribonuclease III [Pseudomonadota bacterium]
MKDLHALNRLQQVIGYTFKNSQLLHLALTHRSYNKQHNERLEFLGDAVLGMIIAQRLFEQFPEQSEGNLTRLRASLVNGVTLAELAREIELGAQIKLGSGELKSGGRKRDSILADAFEALIGAAYLDSDFPTVQNLILKLFSQRIKQIDPSIQTKDSKTQLQEFLQSKKLPLPEYTIEEITGKDHAQVFTVSCTVKSLEQCCNAKGSSRRVAEQRAARLVLEKINS